jgi:hypothetical protein
LLVKTEPRTTSNAPSRSAAPSAIYLDKYGRLIVDGVPAVESPLKLADQARPTRAILTALTSARPGLSTDSTGTAKAVRPTSEPRLLAVSVRDPGQSAPYWLRAVASLNSVLMVRSLVGYYTVAHAAHRIRVTLDPNAPHWHDPFALRFGVAIMTTIALSCAFWGLWKSSLSEPSRAPVRFGRGLLAASTVVLASAVVGSPSMPDKALFAIALALNIGAATDMHRLLKEHR